MKKKIVMVMAVLGMAFATVQVNAQNDRLVNSQNERLIAGRVQADVRHDGGRFYTCACCNPDGGCTVAACE